MNRQAQLESIAKSHPFPLVFATISGAHLYGFPSANSDFDLRGVHLLPLAQVVGLQQGQETIEKSSVEDGAEIDLVTHDAAKFFRLMLRPNGYVLEQLFSPLIVLTTPQHAELKRLGAACITKFHAHHYLGFAETQWRLFEKESPRRVKPLLYTYRVLLTGVHLMKTGRIEANLAILNEDARLSHVSDLIRQKTQGDEAQPIADNDVAFHRGEYERLTSALEQARDQTHLPESPGCREEMHDLLVRLRLAAAQ